MKTCTKSELEDFVKNYPNKLEKDIIHFCEPPLLTFNDFSNGKVWPDSIVASVQEVWDMRYKPTGESAYKILAG